MHKKELTKISKLLIFLAAAEDVVSPAINVYELRNRVLFGSQGSFNTTIHRLLNRGWIKFVDKNAERFITLTKKGELEALVAKTYLPITGKWDGKWRMVIYDIPEQLSEKRDLLRRLLIKKNFYKLQDSVYINPYPLNRAAIKYLEETRLNLYIRIIKIEEIDSDIDLLKHFNLK